MMLDGAHSGAECVARSEGFGVGGASTGGIFFGYGNHMGENCANGTRGVGWFIGAGVGTGNDIELGNEYDIVDSLEFGNWILVGIGVGTMDGIWI